MISMPDLQTALLDILHAIKDADIKLIIGGGFGIFLKLNHLEKTRAQTLLPERPESRSTNDIDLFLRAEFLIHSGKLQPLARAIDGLGYKVVPGAEKYQFIKPGPHGSTAGSVKIDFLTGPQNLFVASRAKVDKRRVRPRPEVGIHAHPVDEAPTLELGLVNVPLLGKISSGTPWKADVFIPHPYTFLMMKLFAFNDRVNDPNKDFGRYHALDLYSILAAVTEEEWNYAIKLRDQNSEHPYAIKAGSIVSENFSKINNMGMIRLRENPYYSSRLQVNEFMSALLELFPANQG